MPKISKFLDGVSWWDFGGGVGTLGLKVWVMNTGNETCESPTMLELGIAN